MIVSRGFPKKKKHQRKKSPFAHISSYPNLWGKWKLLKMEEKRKNNLLSLNFFLDCKKCVAEFTKTLTIVDGAWMERCKTIWREKKDPHTWAFWIGRDFLFGNAKHHPSKVCKSKQSTYKKTQKLFSKPSTSSMNSHELPWFLRKWPPISVIPHEFPSISFSGNGRIPAHKARVVWQNGARLPLFPRRENAFKDMTHTHTH